MPNANLVEIKKKITTQHEGDDRQLDVIFSDSPRLIVEAPAGYGKTTTMISRIAYLFASGQILNPKRILGLTFSVNAALKVKREVAEKLPSLLGLQNSPVSIGEKVTITNYHGFIGALPDFMSKAVDEYGMTKVALSKNYRFRNNPDMLKLHKNIRANAASCFSSTIAANDTGALPWLYENGFQGTVIAAEETLRQLPFAVKKSCALNELCLNGAEEFFKILQSSGDAAVIVRAACGIVSLRAENQFSFLGTTQRTRRSMPAILSEIGMPISLSWTAPTGWTKRLMPQPVTDSFRRQKGYYLFTVGCCFLCQNTGVDWKF